MENYQLNEQFVKKVFSKKIKGIMFVENYANDVYNKMRIEKPNNVKYKPDFVFRLEEQEYYVEVKLKFAQSVITKAIDDFSKSQKEGNFLGIVVILDKVSEEYKNITKEKYDIEIFDISNILYMIYDDIALQKELNKIVDFSLDGISPKETDLKIILKKKSASKASNKKSYNQLLEQIKPGRDDAKRYEKLVVEILKDVFSDELSLFSYQNKSDDGLNIYDMICKIKNNINDDFFSIIENFYKTKYILFEFKNYTNPIKQTEVCTTEKYLFETALRKVAIIISRKGIDANGMRLTKGILRENGKLIIVIDDNDLMQMIKLHEDGEKATSVLTRKLDELLIKLEK